MTPPQTGFKFDREKAEKEARTSVEAGPVTELQKMEKMIFKERKEYQKKKDAVSERIQSRGAPAWEFEHAVRVTTSAVARTTGQGLSANLL